jgi:hypothetical protein
VNRRELALRKELALMHLRIARAELALERMQPPSALSAALPAVELACAVLEKHPMGRIGHYLQLVLRVARVFLNLRQAGGTRRALPAPASTEMGDAEDDGGIAGARLADGG